jgi:DNA-binding IclR family transcriptional regulator
VLLASLTEAERRDYYSRNTLEPLTARTITDVDRLERELEKVRTDGVAYDDEEYRLGLWIAAAPVYNGGGKVIAAAGIMVPTTDVNSETIQKYSTAIKSCAAMISQIIGRIS